jgi:hypothetical protein
MADRPADTDPDMTPDSDQGAVVAELREALTHARGEISRLWSALETRDRELERKDAIILALAQRPALPSPADMGEGTVPQGVGEGPGEGSAATMPRSGPERPVSQREAPEPPPWYRRWFSRWSA